MSIKECLSSATILLGALTLTACSSNNIGGSLSAISVGPSSLAGTPLQGVSAGMPGPFTPTSGLPVSGAVYVTATLTPIATDANNNYTVVKGMHPIRLSVIAGRMATGGAYTSENGLTYALQASSGTINAVQLDNIEGADRLVQYSIYQDGGAAGAPQGPVRVSDTFVLQSHAGPARAMRNNQAIELNGCYYLLTVTAETTGTHILETGDSQLNGLPPFPYEK